MLIRITRRESRARSRAAALLPTLWFRNTWSWGGRGEKLSGRKPSIALDGRTACVADRTRRSARFDARRADGVDGAEPTLLFTENETNVERCSASPNAQPYVKDAFHDYVVHGRHDA